MKFLLIGDIFGKPGRRAIYAHLPTIIEENQIDFTIVNGENAAGGKGLTPQIVEEIFDAGADVISTGNHVRDKKEIDPLLDSEPRLLRPYNYPKKMPGHGSIVMTKRSGLKVAVLNAIGRVHMGEIPSAFMTIRQEVEALKKETPIVIVDFHAEATSEKRAMGWWLDGYASAVIGTHIHVQTADEEVLPNGTAYISDAGMTGPHNSVIGLKTELAFDRFLSGDKRKFEVAKGDVRINGVVVEIEETTGKAKAINRFRKDID